MTDQKTHMRARAAIRNRCCTAPRHMLNIWFLAASAVALAAVATLASRRAKRRTDSDSPSLPSVSDQWLAEQRGHGHEGL